MTAHEALSALADEYYDLTMASSPIALMWVGKLIHLSDWDDFSAAGAERTRAAFLDVAARIEAIDVGDDEADLALKAVVLHAALSDAKFNQWSATLVQVNPKMGSWEMVQSFIDNFPLATVEHGEAYLTKLRTLPDAFDGLAAAATEAAARGVTALSSHLAATAATVTAYLETPEGPEDRLNSQAAPTELDEAAAEAWRQRRNAIVADIVRPGITRFRDAMADLANSGRPDEKPGLVHLPGGDAEYRDLIWANLLLDKDPAELHQLGLDQVAKLEREYIEIAGPLLGTEDVSEIYSRLRDDESLKYSDAITLVADAELALKKADAALPGWFSTLPESECLATSTEFGAMAYYSTPDPEAGKPGRFYFNTSNPAAWSTYELEAIVYHEGVPGHHLQLAINAENTKLHKVQREVFNTAYAEGWGLYAERLADEMGLYSSQLTRVGMLSADSLRACRLVVDTGIHALGWSREQAIQYLLDHSPMDRTHIEQEVDRYIGLPAQALAYMVGRLEIMDIRETARARGNFDIRAFHEQVLKHGAVPLTTLRTMILGD